MLCVSIRPASEKELVEDFEKAKKLGDLVEVRTDGFKKIPFQALQSLLTSFPVLLSDGPNGDAEKLWQLAALQPEYLDVPQGSIELSKIRKLYPKIKLILSYHNFHETPESIDEIFAALECHKPDIIKLVTYAKTSLDGLRMLERQSKTHAKLALFCMGEKGSFTRILGPLYGAAITYSCLSGKETAPGQVAAEELLSLYNFKNLSKKSVPYALIGDPLASSPMHIIHNALIRRQKLDAVFVKLTISIHEFEPALSLMKKLNFKGISVTHPLKGAFGDDIYNAIRFKKSKPEYLNSDGVALLDAIEKEGKIENKQVIILGAGAAGQVIAKEAIARGARVTLSNRTEVKSYLLARLFRCEHARWENLHQLLSTKPYDVLINATSLGANGDALPIKAVNFRSTSLVADIVLQPSTPFLEMAAMRGCRTISGREMWLRQAAYQFCFWIDDLVYEDVLSQLRSVEI